MWVLHGKILDEFAFGSRLLTFKVTEVNTVYQLVNVITCEIADTASPKISMWILLDFSETLHIDSMGGSTMCPTNLNGRIMHRAVLLFKIVVLVYHCITIFSNLSTE